MVKLENFLYKTEQGLENNFEDIETPSIDRNLKLRKAELTTWSLNIL